MTSNFYVEGFRLAGKTPLEGSLIPLTSPGVPLPLTTSSAIKENIGTGDPGDIPFRRKQHVTHGWYPGNEEGAFTPPLPAISDGMLHKWHFGRAAKPSRRSTPNMNFTDA